MEMLQWMAAQDPPCPVNNAALMVCARDGDIPMLRWALQQPQIPQEVSRPFVPHNLPPQKHGRLLPLMQEGWAPENDTAGLLSSMQSRRLTFYACAKRLAQQAHQGKDAPCLTGVAQTADESFGQEQLLQQVPRNQHMQHAGLTTSLGSLPPDILCKIACDAQIDFAWHHQLHAEQPRTDCRVSCSGPCCARLRRPSFCWSS